MPPNTHGRLKTGRTILVLAGLLALVAITVLAGNVLREFKSQSSAQSDNLQWGLSQIDVEFLEFNGRLSAQFHPRDIRRRYDVFYSRIATVRQAKVFADLRGSLEFSNHLSEIEAFLDDTVSLIDVSDTALKQNTTQLAALADDIRPVVRMMSNAGLNLFAERADAQRQAVTRTLSQLAFALAALILALGLGVVYLIRLNIQISRRERDQKQTATRINTIMKTALDGIIVFDEAGRITDFNHAAERIFDCKAIDVIGQNMGQVIVPDHLRDAYNAGIKRMRKSGGKQGLGKGRVQLEAKRADGSLFPIELAVQSATTDDEHIFIAFLRDMSKQVADQAELIQARDKAIAGEQSRSKFLTTMSHEIRTPLNGLLGNISLMRETSLNSRQDLLLRNMETSGRLLMSHVTDVLDIARYDRGKVEIQTRPVNVSALLQDIVDNQSGMAAAQNTTLDWGWVGPAQHWINADPDRLQHILMNLIGNAVKFTKQGRVSVSVQWDKGRICLRVEDTGIGISDNLKARIFDDFVTGNTAYDRDVSGTGLGLSIVKRFVTRLGGEVRVQSALGKGSSFIVEFDTTAAEPTDVDAAPPPVPEKPSVPLRVLVVEDNEINRFVVRNMLVADGHDVSEAHNGQLGVQIANEQFFDLILMDISMPVLDGRKATVAIRNGNGRSAKTRIVALTANAMAQEQKDFLAHGMDTVLTKPLTKPALRAILEDVKPVIIQPVTDLIDVTHNLETREVLGAEVYEVLYAKFHSEVTAFSSWIRLDRAFEEIAERGHNIAGSAATFGAVALRVALLKLEKAAKSEDHAAVTVAIDELVSLPSDTLDALAKNTLTAPD